MMKPENPEHTLPCEAAPLIPHEPPMLLVHRLLHKADDSVADSESVIEAVVPESGPFVKDGVLLPEYYIEVLAQASAASDGFPPERDKKPATGLLTGIDAFTWTAHAKPGSLIRIAIRKTFEFGSAFILAGVITGESGTIAEGQLKIWKMEE